MTKKSSGLRANTSSGAQARAAARAEAMLVEMQLQEIRKNRQLTQNAVARVLQVEQASVSQLEHRQDMYVSTLRGYVKALGGELKLIASFPDTEIHVHLFEVAH
jgi:predicted XRE-type DNA-binding protein